MVNFRLPRFLTFAALAAFLMFTGCATAPQKNSPDDSLVLIPTFVDNTSGTAFGRKYYVQVVEHEGDKIKEFQISDYRASYLMFVAKEPGTKVVGIRSVVDTSRNFRGPDGLQKTDILLPYTPGKAVVADFGFLLKMVRIDNENYSSNVQTVKPDAEEQEDILKKFRSNDQNEAWF